MNVKEKGGTKNEWIRKGWMYKKGWMKHESIGKG